MPLSIGKNIMPIGSMTLHLTIETLNIKNTAEEQH